MVVALQQWIIKNQLKNPAGIILNYPALDMCFKRFYPSYFNLFGGQMLSMFLFQMITSFLLEDTDDSEKDSFISAVSADKYVL